MNKKTVFVTIFSVVFLLMLLAEETGNSLLTFVVKPFIALSLVFYLYQNTRLSSRFYKLVFVGLFFSWLGDILLLFVKGNPNFFILGLVAFLLAHICYIMAFLIHFNTKHLWGYLMMGIVLIFSILYVNQLMPHLGNMYFPVLIYVAIISIMAVSAGFRQTAGWEMVLVGAVFFVVSDSILAYNKFITPLPHAGLLVMSSYMIAQFLITYGSIQKH